MDRCCGNECHSTVQERSGQMRLNAGGLSPSLPACWRAILERRVPGIVTLAQGWQHAVELFWQDKFLVAPILAGLVRRSAVHVPQVGLHTTVRGAGRWRAQRPAHPLWRWSPAARITSRTHSACRLVGLSAATTFLANYKVPFMLLGFAMNLVGIGIALRTIRKARLSFRLAPSRVRKDNLKQATTIAILMAVVLY